MIGKIYTCLFVVLVIASFGYQRYYLMQSQIEFNAQLMAENSVIPTITAKNFQSISYLKASTRSSFSGNEFIYYSDQHFEAQGNLFYQENLPHVKQDDYLSKDHIELHTQKANGEFRQSPQDTNKGLEAKLHLHEVYFPHFVHFSFNDNIGSASHVYFNAEKRILTTTDPIESAGPAGKIKGIGFMYKLDDGEFHFNSDVEGEMIPTMLRGEKS